MNNFVNHKEITEIVVEIIICLMPSMYLRLLCILFSNNQLLLCCSHSQQWPKLDHGLTHAKLAKLTHVLSLVIFESKKFMTESSILVS